MYLVSVIKYELFNKLTKIFNYNLVKQYQMQNFNFSNKIIYILLEEMKS